MATNEFESQRIKVTVGYALLTLIALLIAGYSLWPRAALFVKANPEAVFKLKYTCVFGLLGLTARSWSFKKHGESPFPPYILTYPSIVLGACGAIAALPIDGYRFYYSAPVIAFITGYLPIEAVDGIRKRFGI